MDQSTLYLFAYNKFIMNITTWASHKILHHSCPILARAGRPGPSYNQPKAQTDKQQSEWQLQGRWRPHRQCTVRWGTSSWLASTDRRGWVGSVSSQLARLTRTLKASWSASNSWLEGTSTWGVTKSVSSQLARWPGLKASWKHQVVNKVIKWQLGVLSLVELVGWRTYLVSIKQMTED